MGDIGDFFSSAYHTLSDVGESIYKPLAGEKTTKQIKKEQEAVSGAKAAADAKIRQAEYEEQAAMGTARSRAARRRGFQSTVLTGGQDSLGAGTYADSGKTLLGG